MSYGSYLIILAGAQTRRLCACICSTGGSSNLTFSELNHDDIRERRITQTIWLSGWWFQFGFIAMLIIYNPKGGPEGAFSTYRSRQNLRLMHATLPACLPGPFDTGTFQPPQRPPWKYSHPHSEGNLNVQIAIGWRFVAQHPGQHHV